MQPVCRPQTCKRCLTSKWRIQNCIVNSVIGANYEDMETSCFHLNLGCLFANISMKGRWCLLWIFHSIHIPNIAKLTAYTSAWLRAPPATSQKWLIISSRNIFSDAWRHLCSVWRDLEFRENVTRHNKLTAMPWCLLFSILHSPTLLRVQYS